MPETGGVGVGIADEYAVGVPSRLILVEQVRVVMVVTDAEVFDAKSGEALIQSLRCLLVPIPRIPLLAVTDMNDPGILPSFAEHRPQQVVVVRVVISKEIGFHRSIQSAHVAGRLAGLVRVGV